MPNSQPQEAASLESIGKTVDNAKKIVAPIWAIVVGLLMFGLWFGQFYQQYRDNAENGSPAMRRLLEGQQQSINELKNGNVLLRQTLESVKEQSDAYQRVTDRRLDRLEISK